MKKAIALVLISILLFAGCSTAGEPDTAQTYQKNICCQCKRDYRERGPIHIAGCPLTGRI